MCVRGHVRTPFVTTRGARRISEFGNERGTTTPCLTRSARQGHWPQALRTATRSLISIALSLLISAAQFTSAHDPQLVMTATMSEILTLRSPLTSLGQGANSEAAGGSSR